MPHDLRQRRRKQRGRDCGMHPSGVKRCRPSQHALLPLCTSLPPPHTSGTTSAVGSECPPPLPPPYPPTPHTQPRHHTCGAMAAAGSGPLAALVARGEGRLLLLLLLPWGSPASADPGRGGMGTSAA